MLSTPVALNIYPTKRPKTKSLDLCWLHSLLVAYGNSRVVASLTSKARSRVIPTQCRALNILTSMPCIDRSKPSAVYGSIRKLFRLIKPINPSASIDNGYCICYNVPIRGELFRPHYFYPLVCRWLACRLRNSLLWFRAAFSLQPSLLKGPFVDLSFYLR